MLSSALQTRWFEKKMAILREVSLQLALLALAHLLKHALGQTEAAARMVEHTIESLVLALTVTHQQPRARLIPLP